MAVAVKNTPVSVLSRTLNPFAVNSGLGVAYVLGTIGIVFFGLGWLFAAGSETLTSWGLSPTAQASLGMLIRAAVLGGLAYLGLQLVGPHPVRGLAAGIFFGVVAFIVIVLLTCALGRALESQFGERSPVAIAVTVATGIALVAITAYLYLLPRFEQGMVRVDEQGWFTMAPYKKTQGQKVRRGTILGLLVLAGCGVWTLMNSRVLGTHAWDLVIPFTGGRSMTLLPNLRFSVPLLLAFACFWLAYRVVNYPAFADFLIATEAELNKVSWTTRRRLIQDTIVVLVTVVLLTVFLFVVDQIWAWILTKIGVIQIAPSSGGPGGAKVPY
jgi:preprotein translocase SecE subunit